MDKQKMQKVLNHELLDENNPMWFKVVKALIIIWVALVLLVAFVAGIAVLGNEGSFGLVVWIAGALIAGIDYSVGMLLLNYIGNVRKIREILEEGR